MFVEAVALGDHYTDAYRKSYSGDYTPGSLKVKACKKAAEPHIKEQIRLLRLHGMINSRITLEQRVAEEQAFAQECKDAGNFGAAGSAYDRLNKLLGLYVERSEVTFGADPAATLKELAALIGEDAESIEVRH